MGSSEQFNTYSKEEAQDETEEIKKLINEKLAENYDDAQGMTELIKSGRAKHGRHAKDILGRTKYEKNVHEAIWNSPTDDEVAKLSKPQEVNKIANATYFPPGIIGQKKYEVAELIKMSGTNRLADLGSAHRTIENDDNILGLEELGFKEYIAVDMDIENREFEVSRPTEDNNISHEQHIKAISIRKEILAALHSFPDNYANACITGLDAEIFRKSNGGKWSLAVLRELKRVVPENGFIFTDGGFIDSLLEYGSPDFREVKWMLKPDGIQYGLDYSLINEHNNKIKTGQIEEELKKYESQEDDPLKSLGKYCVNMPEIGFRVYFDELSFITPMIIINTSKTKNNSAG